jgi:hypothetical protein
MTSDISKILDIISGTISGPPSAIVSDACSALQVLASSMVPGEESALTSTVPALIKALRARKFAVNALTALRHIP